MIHPDYAPTPMTCRICEVVTEWNVIGMCRDCLHTSYVGMMHSALKKNKDSDEGAMLIMMAVGR